MGNLPKKLKVFIILVTASALIMLGWNIVHTAWNKVLIIYLLIFGFLGIVAESLPVALPKGGFVTVSYPIFLSELMLFPLGVTLSASAMSALIILGKSGASQPLYKRVYNASQYVLSLALAHGVMNVFQPPSFQINFKFLLLYFMASASYMLLNVTMVSIVVGIALNKPTKSIWVNNFRWSVPNSLALIPLGFLLALLFKNWGVLGLFLLFIPLLASRHAFQLYVEMRENYLNTVEALVQALEAKDKYTSGHSERVGKLVVAVAEEIEMSDDKIQSLK